jgi:hypothetical protein
MKTPAGKECKFYYGDFFRGRNVESCRLIERNPDSLPWKPSLCFTCPVPEILRANQSKTLKLDGKVVNRFLGLKQQVVVTGWCSECFREVPDPRVGCPDCSPQSNQPSIFDLSEKPG